MPTRYHYEPEIQAIVDREARNAIGKCAPLASLRRTARQEDYAGTDFFYVINECCGLAVRVRKNRPPWAADVDVTFRSTEPAKIKACTYAPLALFLWIVNGAYVKGRLIDVYRMHAKVDPPLDQRPCIPNGDGTAFLRVNIGELQTHLAELRTGDPDGWVAGCLQGNERTTRIIQQFDEYRGQRQHPLF